YPRNLSEEAFMAAPVICVRKDRKRFGTFAVLREIDLEVPHGASFALAGENGAGKTTLIKCMLDFCHFDSGSISVQGIPSVKPEARAVLAFLPERFTPPWYLTGREFLASMLRMGASAWSEQRALALFADIGLE